MVWPQQLEEWNCHLMKWLGLRKEQVEGKKAFRLVHLKAS